MTENERVRMIRQDVGHTMREFGAVLGVGSSTISDIENGRRNLDLHTIILRLIRYTSRVYILLYHMSV